MYLAQFPFELFSMLHIVKKPAWSRIQTWFHKISQTYWIVHTYIEKLNIHWNKKFKQTLSPFNLFYLMLSRQKLGQPKHIFN